MGRVSRIVYVRYQAPDLDAMERFLIDFGLVRSVRTDTALYTRGTGTDHHLHITELADSPRALGIGLAADTREALERIAADAGVAVAASDEPAGGVRAILTDPNGFRVDIVHGQAEVEPLPVRAPLTFNTSVDTKRMGLLQRPERGPSHVARLEHAVLAGPNFDAALAFYEGLGMKVSDRVYAEDATNTVAAFIRCGLGTGYTDHHTVALARAPEAGFDHTAYITLDWDDLMLGHHHLKAAGHAHAWGVGRHTLGSEVFDYWQDPFGNKVEHTSDGDMINDDHVAGNTPAEIENFFLWGPPAAGAHEEARA